jgi:hypothetical protein
MCTALNCFILSCNKIVSFLLVIKQIVDDTFLLNPRVQAVGVELYIFGE